MYVFWYRDVEAGGGVVLLCTCERVHYSQGVTKRCRQSWLTNSALVYEPKCGGGASCEFLANEYSCTQELKYTLEI
jgi:hypothetical protein